jgi:hypothetical protein
LPASRSAWLDSCRSFPNRTCRGMPTGARGRRRGPPPRLPRSRALLTGT